MDSYSIASKMVTQLDNLSEPIIINGSDNEIISITDNNNYSGTKTYSVNLKVNKNNCTFDITVNMEISLFLGNDSATIRSFEKQLFYIVKTSYDEKYMIKMSINDKNIRASMSPMFEHKIRDMLKLYYGNNANLISMNVTIPTRYYERTIEHTSTEDCRSIGITYLIKYYYQASSDKIPIDYDIPSLSISKLWDSYITTNKPSKHPIETGMIKNAEFELKQLNNCVLVTRTIEIQDKEKFIKAEYSRKYRIIFDLFSLFFTFMMAGLVGILIWIIVKYMFFVITQIFEGNSIRNVRDKIISQKWSNIIIYVSCMITHLTVLFAIFIYGMQKDDEQPIDFIDLLDVCILTSIIGPINGLNFVIIAYG